jgi:hypothetical protein
MHKLIDCIPWIRARVFNLYLPKGQILIVEKFTGRIHVLQSKVCILLQGMPTNISPHKHTYDNFVILFIYGFIFSLQIIFIVIYLLPQPSKHSPL